MRRAPSPALLGLLVCLAAACDRTEDTGLDGATGGDDSSVDDGTTGDGSTGDEGGGTGDSSGEGGDDTADDGSSSDGSSGDDSGGDSGDDFCADQPVVTYNNFGRSLMTESCQGCHASTADYRYGAPEEVTFDDVDQCWDWQERILIRSTGDSPTMPPSGGVHDDDRLLLEIWLRCADPGT